MPRITTLVTHLARTLGSRRQANAEARWIKESVHNTHRPSAAFAQKLLKRTQGWPLQYLLGSQPFGSLDILTRPPTLIPRPETEDWTLRLATTLRDRFLRDTPLRLLDLCTGTACIPLLLCHSLPPRSISAWAIDVSPSAVELASENVARCRFNENSSGNTVLVERHDIFAKDFPRSLKKGASWEPFDVLTSNPPYIPRKEYDELSHTVRNFEDPLALLGEYPTAMTEQLPCKEDHDRLGLAFYVRIAHLVQYENIVRPGGCVALEVGQGQARAVERMFLPFTQNTDIWTDPWGVERTVFARI
ncbi:S-adenosyl-L-methionine-dependent methyltransferase [Ceratobasidium sp. AG-I]|nr:S-adenosyl-L-methionine-dependent methyltransferase [Ceratobasidium sp. AG-I]